MSEEESHITQAAVALDVLIVDDEAAIRKIFTSALESCGCRVRAVDNGRSALQSLMQESFEVIVVDMRMEEMDGIIFLQEALKIWPWIGVIAVSGFLDNDLTDQLSRLGVTCMLEKPVSLEKLRACVVEIGAEARLHHGQHGSGNALTLMRDHLRLLGGLDSGSSSAETLVGRLLEFGKSLGEMLPSDVVGILVYSTHDIGQELILLVQKPVSELFITHLEKDILRRHRLLSGITPDHKHLTVNVVGETTTENGDDAIGSVLSVPILLDDAFCGSLTLASVSESGYADADVSLLYHAANHITAVFMALRRMHGMAMRDHLTGVYNRIRLEEELAQTWALSVRYQTPMSVVVIDVDNFKTINDSYGHAVGDIVLKDLSRLIRNAARSSDIVARYGGDEFVAILPQSGDADARTFADRFLIQLRDHVFMENSLRLNLTASVGVACSKSRATPGTAEELLSQADRALYLAKRAGRNRLAVWPEQPEPGDDPIPVQEGQNDPKQEIHDRVMVVDDEPTVLSLVQSMLERTGCDITTCSSAADAVAMLQKKDVHIDVLLTDLSMPGKSGIDLLQEVSLIDDSIVKIVMTGYATVDTAVNCLREGAYDFIQKPVRLAELTALINRAVEYRRLKVDNLRYQSNLEKMVQERSEKLAASLEEVRRSYQFTLEAMVAMLDARERQTGRHSVRTRDLAVELAGLMGFEGSDLDVISYGAFLHDIGKISVPDAILLKAGPLTEEEWEIMRSHAETGYRILSNSGYLQEAAEIVYAHHEKFDGTGYPRGLRGKEIPVGARIFSVIDAYDAMRCNRTYRDSIDSEDAVAEIARNAGTQFDPAVVSVFMAHYERIEELLLARL